MDDARTQNYREVTARACHDARQFGGACTVFSGIGVKSSFDCKPPKYEELPRLLLVGTILDNQLVGLSAKYGWIDVDVVAYPFILPRELPVC